jgi:hypothetical protein
VQIIGVAAKDTEQAMQEFVDRTGVGVFLNINDEDGAIWARYGIGYQPAFVFIDDSGATSTFAALSAGDLQVQIDALS